MLSTLISFYKKMNVKWWNIDEYHWFVFFSIIFWCFFHLNLIYFVFFFNLSNDKCLQLQNVQKIYSTLISFSLNKTWFAIWFDADMSFFMNRQSHSLMIMPTHFRLSQWSIQTVYQPSCLPRQFRRETLLSHESFEVLCHGRQ